MALQILTLYLGTGDQFDQGNVVNLTASLFMWCVLPAFGAAAYVPSIVLGEGPCLVEPHTELLSTPACVHGKTSALVTGVERQGRAALQSAACL